MKNIIIIIMLFISLTACSQTQKGDLTIALCEKEKGCTEVLKKFNKNEVAQMLKKPTLFANTKENTILVIEKCDFRNEDKLTIQQLHTAYGGKGEPKKISDFDLAQYLIEKGCLADCPNRTKKISFQGKTNEGKTVNTYFFLNIQADEAYMPDEAFRQMGLLSGEGSEKVVIDQFIRNNVIETYSIAEGKKYHSKVDVGSHLGMQQEKLNEQRFKKTFKKTGKTRKYKGNDDVEYLGKDEEGRTINVWLTPSQDVCLPIGRFDAVGFYNLGYFSIDGITYLITEISGPDFHLKVTEISDGSYRFNPSGYQSY